MAAETFADVPVAAAELLFPVLLPELLELLLELLLSDALPLSLSSDTFISVIIPAESAVIVLFFAIFNKEASFSSKSSFSDSKLKYSSD